MPTDTLESIIQRSEQVIKGQCTEPRSKKFTRYAISNFRGGIGKSTLSFNLSYELSRNHRLLLLDTCSQKNLSQSIFGEQLHDLPITLYNALIAEITNTTPPPIDELVMKANPYCKEWSGGKPMFMIPGSTELFLFPSLLYSQLAQYTQIATARKEASKKVLLTLKKIIDEASGFARPEKVLIDTSPFFGGATHLSWCAAEALIVPVRVDQNSVEALELTLRMLKDREMDFHRFNDQAGITSAPKVHAIVMTHCGWNRQKANTPDGSTKFFVQKALDVAHKYRELFSEDDISTCFYLLDDFHSAGRISGNQRIALARLNAGDKHIVDGQRLDVNPSVNRYKDEIANLAAAL